MSQEKRKKRKKGKRGRPSQKDRIFGRTAHRLKLLRKKHLKEASQIQKTMTKMGLLPKSLPEILVEKGHLTESEVERVWEEAKNQSKKSVAVEGFEIIDTLGQGSVGTVYKARQLSLDRVVALKVLKASWHGNETFVQRFLREAKVSGRLQSPALVSGFDVVTTEDDRHCLVMEYVEGRPLSQILEERGSFAEREALEIISALTEGLREIWEHNMVHRDIKPGNILIDEEGQPKLCDLGLAKPIESDLTVTSQDVMVGSPHYISPEQARNEDLDIRTDIFSLGVVYWEMVVGRRPFDGRAEDDLEIVGLTLSEDIPPVDKVDSSLSDELAMIITRMTRRDREERYENPGQLAEDLRARQEGKPLVYGWGKEISGEISVEKEKGKKGKRAKKPRSRRPRNLRRRSSSSKGLVMAVVFTCLLVTYLVLSFLYHESRQKSQNQSSPPPSSENRPSDNSPSASEDREREKDPKDKGESTAKKKVDGVITLDEFGQVEREKIKSRLENFIKDHGGDSKKLALAQRKLQLLKKQPQISQEVRSLAKEGKIFVALARLRNFISRLENFPELGQPMKKLARRLIEEEFQRDMKRAASARKAEKWEKAKEIYLRILRYGTERETEKVVAAKKEMENERIRLRKEKIRRQKSRYYSSFEQALPPLEKFDFQSAKRRVKYLLREGEGKKYKKMLQGLLVALRDSQKIFELGKEGFQGEIGNSNFAISLRPSGFALGKLVDVTKNSLHLVVKGKRKVYFYSQIQPGQFIQQAREHFRQDPPSFPASRSYGNFALFVYRDIEVAAKYFGRLYGEDFAHEKSQLAAVNYHWFRYENLKIQARRHLSRRQEMKALEKWRILLEDYREDLFAQKDKNRILNQIRKTFEKSQMAQAFSGKVTLERGIPTITYDFNSPQELEDWREKELFEGIAFQGRWTFEDGVVKVGGNRDLYFRAPLPGRVEVQIWGRAKERASVAIMVGGRYSGNRKYGVVAGFELPLGDKGSFRHASSLFGREVHHSGIFKFYGPRRIETLAGTEKSFHKKTFSFRLLYHPRGKAFLYRGGEVVAKGSSRKEGHRLSLQGWEKGMVIKKVVIRAIPSGKWLRNKLRRQAKKKDKKD